MKMKKVVLVFSMISLLSFGGIKMVTAQDQPKPKKDTVNMDTDAKPKFYYAVEDEKSAAKTKSGGSGATIAIVVGVVVVIGLAGFFLLKKKK
jgi:LPXTG-motif cell wall-anchored protein